MGIAKRMWLQDQQQGWSDPRTWVCRHCIGDDSYLRGLVRRAFTDNTCTYCQSTRRRAAPLSAIMNAIYRGIQYSYADEATAGAPSSKEVQIEYFTAEDVVEDVVSSQGLDWPEQLQEDVAGALTEEGWIEAAEGHWMGSHGHEILHYSWTSFAFAVKHKSRFHFHSRVSDKSYGEELSVNEMLPFLGRLVRRRRMLRLFSAQTTVYRVRMGHHAHSIADLGPPPATGARAGRMNPAGIPYFYLSMTEATAMAEARATSGELATASRCRL